MIAHSILIQSLNDVMLSLVLQQIRNHSALAHSVNVILMSVRLQQTDPRSVSDAGTNSGFLRTSGYEPACSQWDRPEYRWCTRVTDRCSRYALISHALIIQSRKDVMSSPVLQQIHYDSALAHNAITLRRNVENCVAAECEIIAHSLMIRSHYDVRSRPVLQQIRYDSAFAHNTIP